MNSPYCNVVTKHWFQVTEEGDEEQQACPTLQQIEENVQNWGQAEPELVEEDLEAEEGIGGNVEHTGGIEDGDPA